MMNYTDKIYENYEVIEQFEIKYNLKLSNRTSLTALLALESMLNSNDIDSLKEIAEDEEDVNRKMAEDLLKYLKSNKMNKPLIIQALELIHQYKNTVSEYIDLKGYSLTMKDLSDMLDLDENYITRNLMPCFDYFKIKTMTRHTLKIFKYPYQIDFINKNVFFSRKSVKDFLLKYLKYSSIRVQVDLFMPTDKYMALISKFKTETTYRRALNKILNEFNEAKNEMEKQIKRRERLEDAYAPFNLERVTRAEYKLFNINEEIANDIISGDIKIQSLQGIRNKIIAIHELKNDMTDNANKKLTSLNDTQMYRLVDERLSSIRFAIDGLSTYNKQLQTLERKIIVRYSVKIKDLVKFREKKNDNYLYSIDKSAYKKIIGDAKTEDERQEKITNYFYKRLMDPNFVVKNNKRKED